MQVFFSFMAQPEETLLFSGPNKNAHRSMYTLDGSKHKIIGFVVDLKHPQDCPYCLPSTTLLFFYFHFYACFGVLLKGMVENCLRSNDEPLTSNIDGVMAL